ncbi:GNAT family N-acetyltransferase [Macrococcus carouselicus]|uniref:N-acetyltransferase n=1 Tax=Macrococcus carouselicus TaxID=69969 RepID=A0A9Q8CIV0_9STAP|nr:GNAT family N-acetyltransferase [Macrococcus carouselicus]TDM03610.1 N-acetyltransferase [Macrococcus carouselicus]
MLKPISHKDPLLHKIAEIHETIPSHYKDWPVTELDKTLRYESMQLLMQHEGDRMLVITEKEALAAFIWYSLSDHTHIKSLWVHPAYRGRGYAVMLKNEVKAISVMHHMPYIAGTVHPDNTNMIAINEKLGYNWEGKKMILNL